MRKNKRISTLFMSLMAGLILSQLSACSFRSASNEPKATPDNEPTLKTLAKRNVIIKKDVDVKTDEAQAIAAYKKFLEIAPNAPQRAEAMRRIADLEMNRADAVSEAQQANGAAGADPDYSIAIARYQEFLKAFPKDDNNDRVLYQLARAQEQSGDLEKALKTLDRLVKDYPETNYSEEAQFRRGELLFSARNYAKAEEAYATVLKAGEESTFHDRALYMQGWAQYKQDKLDEALQSFFGVLDAKLVGLEGDGDLETIEGLTRADRELVEDTFRVTSISLANLQGAESIAKYITTPERHSYEYRVFGQLGELYLVQERVKDAADTFALFVKRNPLDAQAPLLQARVIDIYERNGFANLALEAKKEYVTRYGSDSEFHEANPEAWDKAQSLVNTHLAELARYYHAAAQKSKASADYQEAVHWYRAFLTAFPHDPQAAENNFLLAELLYEDGQFADASVEYENAAYQYPLHAKSADAGYSALLSYLQLEKKATAEQKETWQRTGVASALRFAARFAEDVRTPSVLANAAETLYAIKDYAQAGKIAHQLLEHKPIAPDAQRRVAWTVLAYTAFEAGDYVESEHAYAEILKLTGEKAAGRNDLIERQAAAVYKQGEQARDAGRLREAVGHFERIADIAPQSSIRSTAQFDAAAALLALKDWDAAIQSLEDFRSRYPKHALQAEVNDRLALAYVEKGNWNNAAQEFEKLSAANKDAKLASAQLWQAADLYEKAGARAAATKAYQRYISLNSAVLEAVLNAKFRLAQIAKADGAPARELALQKEIFVADQKGGAARTARTRYLAANAALSLAEPVADAFRKIALVEPLQKQLKAKKAKMEEALKAYAVAADFGVADVSTAATFHVATIYRDFGKALISSERPKKLSKLEREQYDVLLEEQAFPFEEKAIEVHEVNAKRTTDGIYDQWVKRSFDALRELQPVRYGKLERVEGVVDAIR